MYRMESNCILPSPEEAEGLLSWAYEQNPGPWAEHCRVVARAAKTIAERSGLDAERAYVLGLMHDIGRYEGIRGLHHVYAGYELMNKRGYKTIAEICLSHSFPYPDIKTFNGVMDCTPYETEVITSFLSEKTYNNYDKLIQLCDALGTASGVCIMEKRLMDVTKRHGFNDFTIKKWDSFLSLKDYFDKLCGINIYNLFYDEIIASVLG